MLQPVGAIASLYNGQKKSCIEMIKSFRFYNPTSSIVILCDGLVDDLNDICFEYNCDSVLFSEKLGYPSSYDIKIPLLYLKRFLQCSNLIKENFFINLESDCLVRSKLEIEKNCQSIVFSSCTPDWLYFFYNDDGHRNQVLPKMFDFYKKYNVCKDEKFFDFLVGGGGFIYNKKFFSIFLNDWDSVLKRTIEIMSIFDSCYKTNIFYEEGSSWFYKKNSTLWVFDFILSLNIPFYIDPNYDYRNDPNLFGKSDIMKNIIHPYKEFYV